MTEEAGIIDVHAHALTAEFLDVVRAVIPQLGTRIIAGGSEVEISLADGSKRGPFPISFVEPEARVAMMAESGVALHVLSSPPFMFLYEYDAASAEIAVSELNDSLIAWAKAFPDRFAVLASLPLQSVPSAVAEIARLEGEAAVVGVAIGSNIAGLDLDDDRLAPLWEALVAADLPVLIHPVDAPDTRLRRYFLRNIVGNPIETTIAGACLIFGGVLARHRTLRVCLVHGGGFLPYQFGRLQRGYSHRAEARSRVPAAPVDYLDQLWYDTILHDLPALRFMGERMGWDRVVIGTDYPFEMGDLTPRRTLNAAGLTDGQLELVAQSNARKFLRLTG